MTHAVRSVIRAVAQRPSLSAMTIAAITCLVLWSNEYRSIATAAEPGPTASEFVTAADGTDPGNTSSAAGQLAAWINSPQCGETATLPAGTSTDRAGAKSQTWLASIGSFWTGQGNYMPRVMCLTNEAGTPDWPWIIALIVLMLGIVIAYANIYIFWMRCYLAEKREDRNRKLFELSQIFLWCGVCGYAMSIVIFAWPGYRLLAVFMLLLNVWSWRFVCTQGSMRIAFQANRLDRELRESLEQQRAELEALVAQRTEELEEARQVADAASATKSRFLANMSHEIRTPMTAILGFTEVLRERDEAGVHHEHIETIQRNGKHLLSVLNDILDLSKIEAGKMDTELIPVSPRDVVDDVIALLQIRAEAKGLELTRTIGDDVPSAIETDPTRFRQILYNLIGNAIKFTHLGSISVHVATRPDGSGDDNQPRLVVEVRDTGIGMCDEQIQGLFSPFLQADNSTTRRFGGTGLGLSVSRGLAHLLGGEIEVTSEPGNGSVFRLTVRAPVVDLGHTEHDDTKQVEPGPATFPGKRVLVVEDGSDNRRLVGFRLQRAQINHEFAENGRDAIARLSDPTRPAFDLVLMDMMMPVMDGYDASRHLRSIGYTQPIVALTANAMRSDEQRCLDAGCSGYLSKPFRQDELEQVLATHLHTTPLHTTPHARGHADGIERKSA